MEIDDLPESDSDSFTAVPNTGLPMINSNVHGQGEISRGITPSSSGNFFSSPVMHDTNLGVWPSTIIRKQNWTDDERNNYPLNPNTRLKLIAQQKMVRLEEVNSLSSNLLLGSASIVNEYPEHESCEESSCGVPMINSPQTVKESLSLSSSSSPSSSPSSSSSTAEASTFESCSSKTAEKNENTVRNKKSGKRGSKFDENLPLTAFPVDNVANTEIGLSFWKSPKHRPHILYFIDGEKKFEVTLNKKQRNEVINWYLGESEVQKKGGKRKGKIYNEYVAELIVGHNIYCSQEDLTKLLKSAPYTEETIEELRESLRVTGCFGLFRVKWLYYPWEANSLEPASHLNIKMNGKGGGSGYKLLEEYQRTLIKLLEYRSIVPRNEDNEGVPAERVSIPDKYLNLIEWAMKGSNDEHQKAWDLIKTSQQSSSNSNNHPRHEL